MSYDPGSWHEICVTKQHAKTLYLPIMSINYQSASVEFASKPKQMLKLMTKGAIGTVFYNISEYSLTAPTKVSWFELFNRMTDHCSCYREWKMKGQCDQMSFFASSPVEFVWV